LLVIEAKRIWDTAKQLSDGVKLRIKNIGAFHSERRESKPKA
jgi:hypothetical protein